MKLKKLAALLLVGCMTLSMAACGSGGEDNNSGSDGDGPVEIDYATFMVGTHQSAEAEKKVIEEFNKEYEGKIKVNIEELPSDSAYVDKMKTLAASNALPDVVMGKEGIRELAVKNGQAVDLMPLLEEDPEWKEAVGEGAIEYNKDGDALYSIANAKQVIGYFYNKEMFDAVGIKPAETWDEFMSNNEKLKAAGYTPLALMTGENCWTTNLWLAAMTGTDGEEGNEFMNKWLNNHEYIIDYMELFISQMEKKYGKKLADDFVEKLKILSVLLEIKYYKKSKQEFNKNVIILCCVGISICPKNLLSY